jgi:hypothetical protein
MTLSSPVCDGPLACMAMSFWRNAHTARHPVQQFASIAQAHLWGLATSPAASERIRQAAYTHLCVIGAIGPGQIEECSA